MHQTVLLLFSGTLIWLGLDLFFSPGEYKLYGTSLTPSSFGRSPIWLIQALGLLLSFVGLAAFAWL